MNISNFDGTLKFRPSSDKGSDPTIKSQQQLCHNSVKLAVRQEIQSSCSMTVVINKPTRRTHICIIIVITRLSNVEQAIQGQLIKTQEMFHFFSNRGHKTGIVPYREQNRWVSPLEVNKKKYKCAVQKPIHAKNQVQSSILCLAISI